MLQVFIVWLEGVASDVTGILFGQMTDGSGDLYLTNYRQLPQEHHGHPHI